MPTRVTGMEVPGSASTFDGVIAMKVTYAGTIDAITRTRCPTSLQDEGATMCDVGAFEVQP